MPGVEAIPPGGSRIYSATYSHVPVYEYTINGDQIMRRRADDYINATHILKSAGFDKPARTRILEREVQKGIHEKVQGGYGKYQGTWIPLVEARNLAQKNGVHDKLRPIFDYVPGDRSPPPAPKHTTAQSSKPRAPRPSAAARRAPGKNKKQAVVPDHSRMSEVPYNSYAPRETPDHISLRSGSPADFPPGSNYSSTQHRKRKRDVNEPVPRSYEDRQHEFWANELLDYFMLAQGPDSTDVYPTPDRITDLNRAIDEKGHTAMHWAAAMGDMNVVRDLLQRGALMDKASHNGETPFMRAVMFTNNYDKNSMKQLARCLMKTIACRDSCNSSVFHHIVATTSSKSKYACARYYIVTILEHMKKDYRSSDIAAVLNQQDQNGDTAVLIAARMGARKCVRKLLDEGARSDIPNNTGEVASYYIDLLNERRRQRQHLQPAIASSSPVQRSSSLNGHSAFDMRPGLDGTNNGTPTKHLQRSYRSEAANLLSMQLPTLISSRTEALAAEFEKELTEQESTVNEGKRALQARREDVERLRREWDATTAGTGEMDMTAGDDAVDMELSQLEDEVKYLLQDNLLDELADAWGEEGKAPPAVNGTSSDDITAQQAEATGARQTLVSDIMAALSQTGVLGLDLLYDDSTNLLTTTLNSPSDSKQVLKYLRLIRSALRMQPDEGVDVEALLPEILRDLEEERRQSVGVGRDDGAADVSGLMDVDMDGGGFTPDGKLLGLGASEGYGFEVVDGVGAV